MTTGKIDDELSCRDRENPAMVCEKCEKKGKLGKVITPDPWKAGASNTTKPGGRKVGENKLLTASKNRFNPLTTEFKKCRICKVSPSQSQTLRCLAAF